MQLNEWATFFAGSITAILGIGVMIRFLFRNFMSTVLRELSNDHGHSVKDKVTKIEELLLEHITWSQTQSNLLNRHLREHRERDNG